MRGSNPAQFNAYTCRYICSTHANSEIPNRINDLHDCFKCNIAECLPNCRKLSPFPANSLILKEKVKSHNVTIMGTLDCIIHTTLVSLTLHCTYIQTPADADITCIYIHTYIYIQYCTDIQVATN